MIDLRPYQELAIQDLSIKLKQKKRVILCLPTGAGKTVIFTSIILRYLNKDYYNRVLVVTDRIELFKQTFSALSKIGINPDVYGSHVKNGIKITSRCVVSMVETLKRRGTDDIGQFGLIIIDEAHKGNFRKIFEHYPNSMYIGATATPLASKKDHPLKNEYKDISFIIDVPDLIQQKYLCAAISFQMTVIDEKNLKKQNGEFTEKSQATEFNKPQVFAGVLGYYKKVALGRKTMVFCVNIEESINTSENFKSAGFKNVFCVHSNMSKDERERQLNEFHESQDGIMCNCGILTTGYDHPPIDCIILLRATLSLPLYLQMCGRGSRIFDGKEDFIILDFGGNIKRFGLWNSSINWVENFWNPPKKNQGVAPVKECPKCGALNHARATKCESCEYSFPIKQKEYIEGELTLAGETPKHLLNKRINDLTIKEIHELRVAKGYTLNFIYRILLSKGHDYVIEYGKMLGYKKGWYNFQKGLPINSNFIIK